MLHEISYRSVIPNIYFFLTGPVISKFSVIVQYSCERRRNENAMRIFVCMYLCICIGYIYAEIAQKR
jgi:hypothetical protein